MATHLPGGQSTPNVRRGRAQSLPRAQWQAVSRSYQVSLGRSCPRTATPMAQEWSPSMTSCSHPGQNTGQPPCPPHPPPELAPQFSGCEPAPSPQGESFSRPQSHTPGRPQLAQEPYGGPAAPHPVACPLPGAEAWLLLQACHSSLRLECP